MRSMTLVVSAMAAIAGCSNDSSSPLPSSVPENVTGARYAQLVSAEWTQGESVDPLRWTAPIESMPIMSSPDWWTEYERSEPVAGGTEVFDMVVTGHAASLEQVADELTSTAFEIAPREVSGRSAVAGTSVDGAPAVVAIELDDTYTVMVVSHALTEPELTDLAALIEPSSPEAWTAAGGTNIECAPPAAADCPPTTALPD